MKRRREPREIHIPFNDWSRERMRTHGKCATSRTKKYGQEGDWFYENGKLYLLRTPYHISLEEIKNHWWKEEGCNSPAEFVEVWKSIHPRAGWTPDKRVWFHLFREAS